MIKHSSKSKGFLPAKSGPNLTGFYMGKSNTLLQMMQTGGQPSRGAAMLAQATQKQSDIKKLESQQRAEAKRQGRGALFGSVASKGLGLLGSAIAGPLGAGIGSALGKRLGEGIGAGKSRQYDSSGTVFGQQDFRDVEQASRDYTRGMGERAVVSGLKAGLTAGFSPGGGIYGEAARRAGGLRPTLAGAVGYGGASLPSAPQIADTGIMDSILNATPSTPVPTAFNPPDTSLVSMPLGLTEQPLMFQDGGKVQRGALMQAFKEADKNRDAIMASAKERILGDETQQYSPESAQHLKKAGLLGMTKRMSKEDLEDRAFLREQIKSREGLDDMMFDFDPTLGIGDVAVTQSLAPKGLRMSDNPLTSDISSLRAISTFNPPEGSTLDSPRFLRSVLSSLSGMEDGGLIEYGYGGSVGNIEQILKDAGITATSQQLALFEQFDPTSLNRMAEGLQDSLLSGTQQAQQAQAGTGFAGSGAVQQAQVEQRERAGEQMAQATEDASKAFASDTLGEAASMIGQGAEFGTAVSFVAPTVNVLPTVDQGAVNFNGVEYQWDNDSGQYITSAQFEQGMSTYYDDLYG